MPCYKNKMGIDFANEMLEGIETEDAGNTRLPVAVIKSARRKLAMLRAASDERSLRNWKSLDCEVLPVALDPRGSIRLCDQYRMTFEMSVGSQPQRITIMNIESLH